jgi:hypothetical protein
MAYTFSGFFAKPKLPRPESLPPDSVWREIDEPFHGIGIRLPRFERVPLETDVELLTNELALNNAERWIFLHYLCWGGSIDFVYGVGATNGIRFGPMEESARSRVDEAFFTLMAEFGVSREHAQLFEPFKRGFWGE